MTQYIFRNNFQYIDFQTKNRYNIYILQIVSYGLLPYDWNICVIWVIDYYPMIGIFRIDFGYVKYQTKINKIELTSTYYASFGFWDSKFQKKL